MTRRPRHGTCRRDQRGNALILALLALVVTGLAAASSLQSRRLDAKREAGLAEATVLQVLRAGAQALVDEHLVALQQGQAVMRAGVSLSPATEGGQLVWAPTVLQLRDMGYLPAGWTAVRSTLNDGAYRISMSRTPAGCAPAACDVEGLIVITAPVRDHAGAVDGVLIGPILTRAGADGGVSLGMGPAIIRGYHGTWQASNPVPGTPAGVVAMRFGTQSGGMSQFVRVGDLRDPVLRGDLSAAGQLSIAGTSALQGDVRVGPASAPCLTLGAGGALRVDCAGAVTAQSGVFDDGAGGRTELRAGGITASGRMESSAGFRTASARLFEADDPNAIQTQSGELHLRGASGTLAEFRGGSVIAPGVLSGRGFHITSAAVEGAACAAEAGLEEGVQYGATADRSLAVCVNGRWVVTSRIGQAGGACAFNGAVATDLQDGQSVICRGGTYFRVASLTSNFVLVQTLAIDMAGGPVRVAKPSCAPSGGAAAEPLIILSPNNEDVPVAGGATLSGINRYAVDNGSDWTVVLAHSFDQTAMPGNLIAALYCHYP